MILQCDATPCGEAYKSRGGSKKIISRATIYTPAKKGKEQSIEGGPVSDFWKRRVSFTSQTSATLILLQEMVATGLFLIAPLLVNFFPSERELKLRVIAKNGQKIIPKPKDEFGLLAMIKKKTNVTEKDEGNQFSV